MGFSFGFSLDWLGPVELLNLNQPSNRKEGERLCSFASESHGSYPLCLL